MTRRDRPPRRTVEVRFSMVGRAHRLLIGPADEVAHQFMFEGMISRWETADGPASPAIVTRVLALSAGKLSRRRSGPTVLVDVGEVAWPGGLRYLTPRDDGTLEVAP